MDTKWNSTGKGPGGEQAYLAAAQGGADRVEEAEAFRPYTGRKGQIRAVLAFLAFFLGVCLVLGSLGAALGRWACQRDAGNLLAEDWQETAAFRREISDYLREFLELGAGEDLGWYSQWYETSEGTAIATDWDRTVTATAPAEETPLPAVSWDDPDVEYRDDSNVLYRITGNGYSYTFSNSGSQLIRSTLPEGYNFLLVFQDSKVSIWKDGEELDVYGDGVYDGDSDWFVPGYDNFPAGDNVSSVKVYIAVRETPVQYYNTSWGVQTSRMYRAYRSFQESREFWLTKAALLGAGVLCLALWFCLRRERQAADKKIAFWTVHVWTEIRFLTVAVPLCALLLPPMASMFDTLWYRQVRLYGLFSMEVLDYMGWSLAACLENTGALLCLWWAVWLIRNDHRYNPRESRKSLLRKLGRVLAGAIRVLRARDLKRPIQKRLSRQTILRPLALLLIILLATIWTTSFYYYGRFVLLAIIAELALFTLLHILWGRRDCALAHDIGLLADQVEAIRSGDLSTPLDLPADADLRQTAEALNDIRAGLNRALEERTRSERMKVELISNVSHDLKTPLTSVLSYAELLRQEPLEGAAADYARIIDEKAHRLAAMVQDVFEVSKAAAGQLPVHPERLDFAKLLRQTLADLDDPIRQSGLIFRVDLPETPVEIVADGKRLYRVFQNLIDNALQYALPGSRIYLTLKTGEGTATASLRNTSRDELPEGVDFTARFVRGDESRTDGGSGLGLSIAKSFTEACGGAFHVETVADLFTAVVAFPLTDK